LDAAKRLIGWRGGGVQPCAALTWLAQRQVTISLRQANFATVTVKHVQS
jgi:hypothetical protein